MGPPPHAARVLLASHALSKVEVEDETCLMLAQIHERGSRPSRVLMEPANRLATTQGSLRLSPTLADQESRQSDVSKMVDRRDAGQSLVVHLVRLPNVAGTWWHMRALQRQAR